MKLIKGQKGQVLPLVLILMLIGFILIVPTLNYASTSLKAKQVTEKKTLELYAADAGVEEALSYLSQFADNWTAPPPGPQDVGPYEYIKPPHGDHYERKTLPHADELVINGKTVELVRVEREESEGSQYYYKITSTANSTGTDEGSTTVTSYVGFTDFSCLWEDYLAISRDSIVDDKTNEHGDEIKGPYPTVSWSTPDYLEGHYGGQVLDEGPPYDSGLDVNATTTIPVEGLYSDVDEGEKFVIEGESSSEQNKLTLNGTVYIAGDLILGGIGSSKFFTLDLNGQTIFVEGEIEAGNGNALAVNGTGCIIAEGLIYFAPRIEFDLENFVFIMSVTDEVIIWPNTTDFNGAIVGADTVELKSGTGTYTHDPPEDLKLNFPQNTDAPITILSWQIK